MVDTNYTESMDKQFISISFDEALLKKIEDFRFRQRFATRTEAIRWLLEYALKQKPRREEDSE